MTSMAATSCPEWAALAAWRNDPQGEEPAQWREALAHFDKGCPQCRRNALAADPTLVFRRLVRVAEPTPAQQASDVDAMRRAVAAMRAASRVEEASRRSRASWSWQRWAAAAALALAVFSLPGMPSGRARLHPEIFAVPAAGPFAGVEASFKDDLPTVDGVDRPDARIYQMDGEELSVVMIVDESLDV